MTKKATLNGSANLFAKATEAMFNDALNASRQELKEDLQAMEDRLNARSDERIDTTNKNMQAQFASQEKMIFDLKN